MLVFPPCETLGHRICSSSNAASYHKNLFLPSSLVESEKDHSNHSSYKLGQYLEILPWTRSLLRCCLAGLILFDLASFCILSAPFASGGAI